MGENPLCRITNTDSGDKSDKKQLETRILENAFTKVLSLLSVGFGEAGAEIISDNIKNGGDLNPMIPGRRTAAIFGFCDIRQFTGVGVRCRCVAANRTAHTRTGLRASPPPHHPGHVASHRTPHRTTHAIPLKVRQPETCYGHPGTADTTEVLQEQIMEFVNNIAKIVHQEVRVPVWTAGGSCVGGAALAVAVAAKGGGHNGGTLPSRVAPHGATAP